MKKLKGKHKVIKLRNDIKKFKIKRSRRKRRGSSKRNTVLGMNKNFKLPGNFSIIQNTNETVMHFNLILDKIKKIDVFRNKSKKYNFIIDMKDITNITIDALLYLLALIKNTKLKYCTIHWIGNLPSDINSRNLIQESGFLEHVNTSSENIKHTTKNIQIKSGINSDSVLSSSICDFVVDKLLKNKKETIFLQKILIELMSNVIEHAYNSKNSRLNPYWYIFVEYQDNKTKFTFVDTGAGIPNTINKKINERFKDIKDHSNDSKYIYSALKGENRTETKQSHRGTGLPYIYSCNCESKIFNLTIISNYGYYNEETKSNLTDNMNGTVVYWEIIERR